MVEEESERLEGKGAGKFNKISSLSPWATPTKRPGPLAVTMETQHLAPRDVTAPSICRSTESTSHGLGVGFPLSLSLPLLLLSLPLLLSFFLSSTLMVIALCQHRVSPNIVRAREGGSTRSSVLCDD